jgi:hypothetical protein
LWAPLEVGAWLTGGVVIALSSQVISGFVQFHEPHAEAIREFVGNTAGINVAQSSLSLTGYWTIDLLATIALAALALWAGMAGRRSEHPAHEGVYEGAAYESAAYEGTAPGEGTAHGEGAAPGPPGPVDEDWPARHHWPTS